MKAAIAVLAAVLLAGPAALGAASAAESRSNRGAGYTFAVGDFAPTYTPPEPGSYELPPIASISDHELLGADGKRTTLSKILAGHLAVVSFIYGSCGEAEGCPMSTAVLHRLDARLTKDPKLGHDVVLLSVSFDPARDTPQRLARMQQSRADGSSWRFVTAPDDASLHSLLHDFGQSLTKVLRPDGSWTGAWRHVLKVFLLDARRQVRNIYSSGFLDDGLLQNDLRTLAMERGR